MASLRILRVSMVAAILAAGWFCPFTAPAVILGKTDGMANTTAPADDPGWDRVGQLNGGSAVYLGNDFVLSARHLGAGDVLFNGIAYTQDLGFAPQFLQTQSGPDQFADLVIFKINSGPVMDFIPLFDGTEAGKTGTYIGFGLDRGTEIAGQGWLWGSTPTKRWGQNVIDAAFILDQGDVYYEALTSDFDRVGGGGSGLAEENHAATGDSGGALFIKDGGVWYLAGIMTSVSTEGQSFYDNNPIIPGSQQPDQLISVRLSEYDDWVFSVIPEPRTYSLLLGGAAMVGLYFFRKRS